MITRPMLAQKVTDLSQVVFPCYATPKIDGIRCLKLDGRALTRSFKDIPNTYVRACISRLPDGVDGEIVLADKGFNDTQSAIMSQDGVPDFHYLIFDWAVHESAHWTFNARLEWMQTNLKNLPSFVSLLPQHGLHSKEQLEAYENEYVLGGYEGVCTRAPHGFYKSGRSTLNQQFLLKLKRFHESEAEITGFVELQHNENEKTTSELGLTKRSKAQAGLYAGKTLGALQVRDLRTNVQFEIGTGFTASQRSEIWANRPDSLGQIVTYKFQPFGMKDKPRCPVFKGFRYDL